MTEIQKQLAAHLKRMERLRIKHGPAMKRKIKKVDSSAGPTGPTIKWDSRQLDGFDRFEEKRKMFRGEG